MADHVDGPTAVVLAAGSDQVGQAGQGGEALGARGRPDERGQPVAVDPGLLEPLVRGQALHPHVDRLDDLVGTPQQAVAQLPDHGGVRRRVDAAVARRQAPAHLRQHARRAVRALPEPVGALPHREGVVQRGQALLGRASGPEGPEVVGPVVDDPLDERQPRPRLGGQLDEGDLLGEARAPVVARLVLGDESQLAHLGLQRRGALDAGHLGRQPDHLAHPAPGLRGGEVGPHPGPQVSRGADVEDPATVVAEQVDAGGVGQVLGQVPLATHGRADPRGERLELLERVDAQPAEPLHQAVQHVDRRPRVGQRPVVGRRRRPEDLGQRRQLAVGGVVARDHPPRHQRGVEDLERRPRPALHLGEVAQEADVERRVVGHQHAAARELEERRQRRLDRRRVGHHRVGDAGQHGDERRDRGVRVDQGLELAQDLAAAHLDRADLGDHRARRGGPARGLEVDDAERHLAQRPAELVESALRLPLRPRHPG